MSLKCLAIDDISVNYWDMLRGIIFIASVLSVHQRKSQPSVLLYCCTSMLPGIIRANQEKQMDNEREDETYKEEEREKKIYYDIILVTTNEKTPGLCILRELTLLLLDE